jgi:hypothetical protein
MQSIAAPRYVCFLCLVSLLCCVHSRAGAAAGDALEYRVKAGFLYNFTLYVAWPDDAFADDAAPFRIALYGTERIGAAFDQLTAKTVRQRDVTVSPFSALPGAARPPCHMLYIDTRDAVVAAELLARVAGQPVLTIGHMPGFAEMGGMINFYLQDNKLRFEINPAAAKQAGLTISSQLLKLARIIDSPSAPQP